MSESALYSRQRILAEVGPVGQERIERSSATISGTDGDATETSYLRRAGVSQLTLAPTATAELFPYAGAFRFDAARRVGAGAWRALRKLRDVLEIDPS